MKILLLEPHGDDALLSCSSLLRTNNHIDILTFSEDRPSTGIEEFYPSVKSTLCLGYKGLDYAQRPTQNTHVVRRNFKENKNVSEIYDEEVKQKFGYEYEQEVALVADYLEKVLLAENYDVLAYPVGLNHPYHIAVREGVERAYTRCKKEIEVLPQILMYADKPYTGIRYVRDMFHSRMHNELSLFDSFNTEYVDKDEEIKTVLKKVYPTEMHLLRFYSETILYTPDTYVYDIFEGHPDVLKLISEVKVC